MPYLKPDRKNFYVWIALGSAWGRVGPWSTLTTDLDRATRMEDWLRDIATSDPGLVNSIVEGHVPFHEAWKAHELDMADTLPRTRTKVPAFRCPTRTYFQHEPADESLPVSGGVYVLYSPDADRYKVGYTTNFRRRINGIRNVSPVDIKVVALLHGRSRMDETRIHLAFDRHRTHGEWFDADDRITDWLRDQQEKQEAA